MARDIDWMWLDSGDGWAVHHSEPGKLPLVSLHVQAEYTGKRVEIILSPDEAEELRNAIDAAIDKALNAQNEHPEPPPREYAHDFPLVFDDAQPPDDVP